MGNFYSMRISCSLSVWLQIFWFRKYQVTITKKISFPESDTSYNMSACTEQKSPIFTSPEMKRTNLLVITFSRIYCTPVYAQQRGAVSGVPTTTKLLNSTGT